MVKDLVPLNAPMDWNPNESRTMAGRLNQMADMVEGFRDGEEAKKAYDLARSVTALAKIHKAAREVRVAAMRLEAVALRKLGQLRHRTRELGNAAWACAQNLASMSDVEFDKLLHEQADAASPVSMWRAHKRAQGLEESKDIGREIARGNAKPVGNKDDLADAARQVLAIALENGQATSVGAAAWRLAEELDLTERWEDDAAVRTGLRETIRLALLHDFGGKRPEEEGIPAFFTYYDEAVGWVHIPAELASLSQGEAWAALRATQARDMTAAAEKAAALIADAQEAHKRHPDVTNLMQLLDLTD